MALGSIGSSRSMLDIILRVSSNIGIKDKSETQTLTHLKDRDVLNEGVRVIRVASEKVLLVYSRHDRDVKVVVMGRNPLQQHGLISPYLRVDSTRFSGDERLRNLKESAGP